MWDIITRMAGNYRILIIFQDSKNRDAFKMELSRLRVQHEILQSAKGSMDERIARWENFVRNKTEVCLTTGNAVQSLPLGLAGFTVYPNYKVTNE
jgi:hypothetical protein